MKQFKELREFLIQIAEAVISASGGNAESHHEKYVRPYLPGNEKHAEGTHTLAANAGHIEKGSQVTIHGHRMIDGKSHVTISKPNDARNKTTVPVSRLEKPGTKVENEVARAVTKIAFYICVAFVLNILIQSSTIVMCNFIESTKTNCI
jgi:hypothetical protein